MKRFSGVLALVYGCLFSFVMLAQSSRPPIVDKGTTEVYGDLNRYSRGQLSDFSFSGMDFGRQEEPFEPDPFSDYRVELTLADGTVVSGFLVLDESEASNEPIPEGESRVGAWQACFPSVLEAKELRIMYMNQVVYSTKPPNGPLPYQPVLTQIDKDKVRIEPVQVEEIEYAYRGGAIDWGTFKENLLSRRCPQATLIASRRPEPTPRRHGRCVCWLTPPHHLAGDGSHLCAATPFIDAAPHPPSSQMIKHDDKFWMDTTSDTAYGQGLTLLLAELHSLDFGL